MTYSVYVHRDIFGKALYVGYSSNLIARQSQHMRGAAWATEIARIDVEWFETEAEAREAEMATISNLQPVYNVRREVKKADKDRDTAWRNRLAAAIEESGKSKRMLSLAIGCTAGYVHGILSEGKEPTVGNLVALCAELGLSVDSVTGAQ